jgi:hypothetical protein
VYADKVIDDMHRFIYTGEMIGFLIKKTFFDLWDNMFRIFLINIGFIISLAIPLLLPGLVPIPILSIIILAAGIFWCFVYLAAAAISVKAISDYGTFGFSDFFRNIKTGWPAGIVMGLTGFLLFIMAWVIIPFYLKMDSTVGLFLGMMIFWTLALAVFSLQFFFAIRARLDTKSFKIIKKCFIIFFDNPGFSVFSLLYTIVTLILSILLAFLLPGPAGLLLFLDEGLRLRLLKYDWLEANPDIQDSSKRRAIPWDVILIDEREKTGDRTLRNFIFPWRN